MLCRSGRISQEFASLPAFFTYDFNSTLSQLNEIKILGLVRINVMTTKNHALYTMLFMFCLIFPASAAAQASSGHPQAAAPAPSLQVELFQGQEVVAGEVLVKFRSVSSAMASASPEKASAAMAAAIAQVRAQIQAADSSIDLVRGVGGIGVVRLHSISKSAADLMNEYSSRPDVEYVTLNGVNHDDDTTPNDPDFSQQWNMPKVSMPTAWDVTTGSRTYVVGDVESSGVEVSHPDLAANIWSAPRSFTVSIGGQSITCPAGSHGFNSAAFTCDPSNPNGDHHHGTHVSGIMGAVGNNGIGVVGVNWTASMLAFQTGGADSGNIDAIEFAIQLKLAGLANVRALNNSYGNSTFNQAFLDEINRANANGILMVCSAGNLSQNIDTSPHYPASYGTSAPNVICVANTQMDDTLDPQSSFGPTTCHLAAPGHNILSTFPNGTYALDSGTSMSAPHVTGAAAFILNGCPNLDNAGVKAAILNNVDKVSTLSGKVITGGRLNVNAAIRSCVGNQTPNFKLSASPISVTVTQGSSGSSTITVTSQNGFNAATNLSASGMPAGVTASFSANPVTPPANGTATSTVTFAASSAAATGTFTVTITGTSGTLTPQTTSVTLTVNAPPADFTLTATPSSQTIAVGGSTSYAASVSPVNGFTGSVALTVSGLPSGATASFNPSSISGGSGSSTLNITTNGSVPPGNYTLTITGTSTTPNLTHTATVMLSVNAQPDFTLTAAPGSQTVIQGNGTSYTVNVGALNGFNGAVSLSLSGTPAGTTATLNPASLNGSGSSTLSVNTSSSTATGSYTLTVTSTSGTLTHTVTVTLVVNPPPDFQLAATPSSQTVVQGNNTSYTVNVGAANGFNGTVALTVSGAPAGATATLNPASVNGSGSSMLSVSTSSSTAIGSYTLNITGTSGSLAHSATVTLVVTAPPPADFMLSATPSSQTVTQGNSTTYTATVTPVNGYAGTVALSATGLPTGATASFNPASISGGSGTSTLTITTSSTTPANSYTLTITGNDSSAGLSHSTSVALVVNQVQQCVTAGASWQNSVMPNQTGTFMVSFDATPSASPINSVIALSNGAQTAYTGFATLARFNPSGDIDARDGGAYNAVATIPYSGGVTYHFREVINISAHTYSVFVTAPGGNEQTVGSNFAFRTEQNTVTSLNWWGVFAAIGSDTVCNFMVGSGGTPDFSLMATPSSQTVVQGSSTSYTVNVGALNGFNGSVALSASGLPAGASATFTPASVSGAGSSTLTVATASSTPAGSYTVTIMGTSGSLTHTASVNLMVTQQAVPNFTVAVSPASQTVNSGSSASYSATVTPLNGFNGNVTLSVTGLPMGATATFTPATVSGSGSSTLTVATSSSTPAGTSTLTVTGTSGTLVSSATATLTINSITQQCVTATAGGPWQNTALSTNETGTFTATFDATPSDSPINSVIALSQGAQNAYTGFATLARFNPSGDIDARDGGAYNAVTTIPYTGGQTYHFRLVINIPAATYSVFVTPPGGSEQTVGSNFAFRTEQSTVTSLNWWGAFAAVGSDTVCNFAVQ